MADGNSSPGMSSNGSGDRDTEWPPLESGNGSGSPGSADGKPQQGNKSGSPDSVEAQPQQGSMSGSPDSAAAEPQQANNRGAKNRPKQKWEVLPVDINLKGGWENRRNNLPPRMMNQRSSRPFGKYRNYNNHQNNNGVVRNRDGPFVQQVPPIPPPVAPYGLDVCPVCRRTCIHPNPMCNGTFVPPETYGGGPNTDSGIALSPTNLPPTSWRPDRPVFQLKDGSDHRKLQIKRQVEYYFKPENLMGDSFLRQNMDSEGYVPISLIATFPRIFQLTKDIEFITESLQLSEILEVVGEKVRSKLIPLSWLTPNGGIANQAGPSAYPPGAQFAAILPSPFHPQQLLLSENYVPEYNNNMPFYGNSAVFRSCPPVVHPYNPFGMPPPTMNFPVFPAPANNFEPDPEPKVMPDPKEPTE